MKNFYRAAETAVETEAKATETPVEKAPEVKAPPKKDAKTEANKKRSKRYVKGAQKKEEPREQEDTFRL